MIDNFATLCRQTPLFCNEKARLRFQDGRELDDYNMCRQETFSRHIKELILCILQKANLPDPAGMFAMRLTLWQQMSCAPPFHWPTASQHCFASLCSLWILTFSSCIGTAGFARELFGGEGDALQAAVFVGCLDLYRATCDGPSTTEKKTCEAALLGALNTALFTTLQDIHGLDILDREFNKAKYATAVKKHLVLVGHCYITCCLTMALPVFLSPLFHSKSPIVQ
jgi:hypothetical protein